MIRILLLHGYVYEYKFEYIDKETKQQVSKTVRFNDPMMTIPRKLIYPCLVPEPLSTEQEGYYYQLREIPPNELLHKQKVDLEKLDRQKKEEDSKVPLHMMIQTAKQEIIIQLYRTNKLGDQIDSYDFG